MTLSYWSTEYHLTLNQKSRLPLNIDLSYSPLTSFIKDCVKLIKRFTDGINFVDLNMKISIFFCKKLGIVIWLFSLGYVKYEQLFTRKRHVFLGIALRKHDLFSCEHIFIFTFRRKNVYNALILILS